ncbi:MAG TPA: hypothetical protein VJ921_06260 [Vicinamibacteria bacterium]|nr:hypothetical protein [Vicinamibacteria bacterium]
MRAPGEDRFVLLDIQSSGTIQIDARASSFSLHGYQTKRRRFGRYLPFERIVERPGDERADAQALLCRAAPNLLRQAIVEGNGRSHMNIITLVHHFIKT